MSWSLAQFKSDLSYPGSSAGGSLAFPGACTPGSLLVYFLTGIGAPASVAINDGVNTWSQIGSEIFDGYGSLWAFWAKNTSSSALVPAWVLTPTGTLGYPAFQVAEFIGAAASPFDISAAAGGTGITSCAVATNAVNNIPLILGFPIPSGGAAITPASPWAQVDAANGMLWNQYATHGTYSPTFTTGGSASGIIAAAFYGAAAVVAAQRPRVVIMGG